nr:aldo/keto reductase [Luteithermobacter gelatinilyticus]
MKYHDFLSEHPRLALTRRNFMETLSAALASSVLPVRGVRALPETRLMNPIPATGETIPAIGMGTWGTFNVGQDQTLRDHRVKILDAFFDGGGGLIDSSPMYGSSEEVIGYGLARLTNTSKLFSATKVWTWFTGQGPDQMATSRRLWGVERFDLMQVHNLLNWQDHLKTLRADQDKGLVRYIGVTTSHGRRHGTLENIMRREPLDFVQFTYNILDREAEQRLLPLAADRGIAVIINRPFRRKELIHRFRPHPLPIWAAEIGCTSWAQFLLKFIISHPHVTCTIPATSQIPHMRENMAVLAGPQPDQAMRRRMVDYVENL